MPDEEQPWWRGHLWPEPWASQVGVEADAVRGALATALARRGGRGPAEEAAQAQVEQLLATVRGTLSHAGGRRRLLDRWRGATVERAWCALHAAKVALVDVLPEDEVRAAVPDAVSRVSAMLPVGDPIRTDVEKLVAVDAGRTPGQLRSGLKHALQVGYDASDRRYAQVRSFRNLLYKVAAALIVATVLLVGLVAWRPTAVPFCAHPDTAGQPAGVSRTVCPSGEAVQDGNKERRPARADVVVVVGLGMLGGVLATAFAVRKLRGSEVPYDVPLALAVLKVPLSALTAAAGLLLVNAHFVPGLSELDSQRQILGYAVVFGYAQQLITSLVDKRAQAVLDSVPSKEPAPAAPA